MNHYQQQVLKSTPYYNHWLSKIKNHDDDPVKHLNTIIKNETLISTITQHNQQLLYHTKPIDIFFIVLRVETTDYILLTTNQFSDIGSGHPHFLQLPFGDINQLDFLQTINLSITKDDCVLLDTPKLFNPDSIIKSSPYKLDWLSSKNDNDVKGWYTNPNLTTQYTKFYQIIKSISFNQFFNIINEIEHRNSTNQSKLVIVNRDNLLSCSPDLRTLAALYLVSDSTNQTTNHPSYFLDKPDIYFSLGLAFFLTLVTMIYYSY